MVFKQLCRHRFAQIRPRQSTQHHFAQIALRQARHGGVDRRERSRQIAARRFETGVHHGETQKAPLHLAPRPDHITHRQRFLLRRVKAEKPKQASVRAIINRHQQLSARAVGHIGFGDNALDLHRVALPRIAQLGEAGFVLVAQRQVQGEVNIAVQPQLGNALLQMRFFVRYTPRRLNSHLSRRFRLLFSSC